MGSRIRKLINQSVINKTSNYRNDNIRIVQQYMKEQSKRIELDESIRYASRLQRALLPSENELRGISKESFLLSIPRNELSGDFSWYTRSGSKIIIAVADCTGHGIPGALMSVLGLSLLNQVVLEERCYEPSHILRRIDERMRLTFQHSEETQRDTFDGMDIGLCMIDTVAMKLTFSGATRPCWLILDGKLLEIKGSRYPIGGMRLEETREYPSTEINYSAGDQLYLFTDGYSDQFGGKDDKKVTKGRLRQLIEMIKGFSVDQQKEQLHEFFLLWKGSREQTDDVTLLGMKL
ncbi:MAG: serine/threonine-protein phosphatase [Bacteroidota bacterium]|nr:serine/threonine-protein phosphatase [Bacteroidota bacterium]